MPRRQKLELTWIGKENRPRLEPRILLEDPEHSHHAAHRVSDGDHFDNVLIHGDNLLALKALEADYAGTVKCVCIDPPYNTGSAFTHYDDGVEHSLWLSLMRDRLEIMRRLLADDGTLWVFVDDNEAHYLKVMLDELFGRGNFVGNVIWQKKFAPANDAKWLSDSHDHVLVYAKDKERWSPNKIPRDPSSLKSYKNPDDDPRGVWMSGDYTCAKNADERPNLYYPITNPNTGKEIWPKRSRVWAYGKEQHEINERENRLWWGKKGTNGVPRYKRFFSEVDEGVVPQTVWTWQEVGNTQDSKREQIALDSADPFPTPKPERVIERILTIATDSGDLVLDSFAGSGTTGAVAHKMSRRWVMVELGDHAFTHVVPRMRKVVDGEDPGGVTESNEWAGGGGFRTYRLAPSLMEKDKWGRWVVNPEYNAEMLAEALCKHEGFAYAPSDERFWEHGHSTETDFVYVTTQTLTADQLRFLSDDVGPDRTLLVLCSAWRGDEGDVPNLTLKKIPNAVLDRCEWGRDDYSLNVAALPEAPAEVSRETRGHGAPEAAPTLFDHPAR